MENFIDHMVFVCFSAAAIGAILGIPCYIFEKLDDRMDGKLSTAISNFFAEDTDDRFEEDWDED